MISIPLKFRRAFTLIELLVVIAIIGVLVSISLPLFNRVMQQGRQTKTLSNMRQLGAAVLLYAGDNNQRLPNRVSDDTGGTAPKWPSLLQQYLPDPRVYSSPIPPVANKSYAVTDPTVYFKSPFTTNYTSYIYNGWNDMGAYTDSTVFPNLSLMVQASQTILFGIPLPQAGQFYMDFVAMDNNTVLNRTPFFNACPYVFGDGSARILAYNSDSTTYKTSQPPSSGSYSDWCWLMNKDPAAASTYIK